MTKFETAMYGLSFLDEIENKSIKEKMPVLLAIIADHEDMMLILNPLCDECGACHTIHQASVQTQYAMHSLTEGWTI